jgi:sugar phosphate isomerase/epimerase
MKALDNFEAGTVIARKLGSNIVNIVAPWPREMSMPGGGYLPRYYDIINPKENDVYAILMDPSFDWDRIWEQYVTTTKDCLERVKKHNMLFTIEHHTNCIIHDASSFLLLCKEIPDKSLGYNMDVGWTQIQREYPPVAIHKVKDRLYNLHMRDIDGAMRLFIHIGEGVMDFAGIIRTLKQVGYKGFVSLEQDGHPGDMKVTCKRYLDLMRKLIAEN